MNIADIKLLNSIYEQTKSGVLLQKVNDVSSNPDLTYKIIIGTLAIGGFALVTYMYGDLLGAWRQNKNKDDDNFVTAHKFVGNGYTKNIK